MNCICGVNDCIVGVAVRSDYTSIFNLIRFEVGHCLFYSLKGYGPLLRTKNAKIDASEYQTTEKNLSS